MQFLKGMKYWQDESYLELKMFDTDLFNHSKCKRKVTTINHVTNQVKQLRRSYISVICVPHHNNLIHLCQIISRIFIHFTIMQLYEYYMSDNYEMCDV